MIDLLPIQLTPIEADEEDFTPPPYSKPGRMLFEIVNVNARPAHQRYDIEVHDYDGDSSLFWMHESGFMDYEVANMVDLDEPGFYVLEGVTGYYHRGDWSYGEDDYVQWEFERCRRATEEEIRTECLGDE